MKDTNFCRYHCTERKIYAYVKRNRGGQCTDCPVDAYLQYEAEQEEKIKAKGVQKVSYKHDWDPSEYRSVSGKMLFVCKKCGLFNTAPVKEEFEHHPCGGQYEEVQE